MSPQQDDQGSPRRPSLGEGESEVTRYAPAGADSAELAADGGTTDYGQATPGNGAPTHNPDPNATKYPTPADRDATHYGPAPPASPFPGATPTPSGTLIDPGRPAPRIFVGYELLEELGRGGMGVVYKARQVAADRIVALKMIKAGEFANDDEVRRFRREAKDVADLKHPHIVPVYEVGEHQGQHYFTMPLVEGGSLARHLDSFRDHPKRVARLVAMVARAVHYAHQRQLLHRDLKPGNVLLDGDGHPHVADFGLAKRLGGGGEAFPSAPEVGTPSYMAPEQARAEGRLTTAADVYGLGGVLYALLAGRPPFQAATRWQTLQKVVSEEPLPPSVSRRGVPHDLEVICLKCLAKDPLRRYASAEALAEDLERWLQDQPVRARAVGPLERAWMWCRRNPAVAGLLAAVAVALMTGTVVSGVFAYQANEHAEQARINEEAANAERAEAIAAKDQAELRAREAHKAIDILVGMCRSSDYVGFNAAGFSFAPVGSDRATITEVLDRSVPLIENDAALSPGFKALTLDKIGNVLRSYGRYDEARKPLATALKLRRGLPDLSPLTLAESYHSLGWLELEAGRLAEADAWLREAHRLRDEIPADDLARAEAKWTLGILLMFMGKTDDPETERLLVDALEIRTRLLGEDDEQVAAGQLFLADVYNNRLDLVKAAPLVSNALRVLRKKPSNANLVASLEHYNTAVICTALKNYKGAEKEFQICVDLGGKAVGPQHEYLTLPLYQLGLTLKQQDRPEHAVDAWRKAYDILKERHILCRPRAFRLVEVYADLLAKKGRNEEAVALLNEALDAIRNSLGNDHVITGDVLVRASVVFAEMKMGKDEEQLLREARETYRRAHFSPPSRYECIGLENLIRDLLDQRKAGTETEQLLGELAETINKLPVTDRDENRLRWLRLRMGYFYQNGRHEEALADAREYRRPAAKHPDSLSALAFDLAVFSSEEEQEQIRLRYAEEAVATVKEAVDCGFADWKRLETAPAFKALREREDLRQLIEKVQEKGKKP
jgi:tetratricopeptide (TPR) repeat protein